MSRSSHVAQQATIEQWRAVLAELKAVHAELRRLAERARAERAVLALALRVAAVVGIGWADGSRQKNRRQFRAARLR
mgnify:CR=1 FL=1